MAEIIKGMPIADYHAPNSGWVSHSKIHEFVEHGAAYYRGRFITGEIVRKETDSLIFGQAFEDYFQRGEGYFREHYAVTPAHFKDGRATPAKQWKASQTKPVIGFDRFEAIQACAASLRTCDKGMALIEGAEEQVTLRGEVFGLRMQSRPDYVHLSDFGAYSVDLKTTANLNDFLKTGRAVLQFGHHTQAAIVRKLLAANGYEGASAYLFVVESQEPYRRACLQLPDDYLTWADQLLEKECAELKRCLDTDTWPLGPDEIITLQKPGWARVEETVSP